MLILSTSADMTANVTVYTLCPRARIVNKLWSKQMTPVIDFNVLIPTHRTSKIPFSFVYKMTRYIRRVYIYLKFRVLRFNALDFQRIFLPNSVSQRQQILQQLFSRSRNTHIFLLCPPPFCE